MDGGLILDSPWPDDLDPAAVPFRTRTETVLRRAGYYEDSTRFDTLTDAEVMGWWNAGVATVADLRFAGNRAIRQHHKDTHQRWVSSGCGDFYESGRRLPSRRTGSSLPAGCGRLAIALDDGLAGRTLGCWRRRYLSSGW